jgi:long-chain acyl-CoA synthetase
MPLEPAVTPSGNAKPTTIPEVLRQTAARWPDRLALRQPGKPEAHTWTWKEYLTAAEEIAAGLRALGIGRGDHVAICSETRAEFYLADQGILMNGSVAAALYPSYPAPELVRTIGLAEAKALFVEDPAMLATLRDAPVQHFFLLTGEASGQMSEAPAAMSLDALRALGRAQPSTPAKVLPEDYAILYLTSGATGDPKRVLATQGSLTANIHMAPDVITLTPDDITVAFLPSAHIAQRVVVELLPILTGTPVSFAESLSKLPGELKSVKPTFFLAPPRVWERMYTSIRAEVQKKPPAAQKAFHAAVALGREAGKRKRAGKRVPFYMSLPLALANRLIFAQIRERLGGRLRAAISGAAPLSPDLAEFYEAIGIPLIEGYGLTEGGVAAFNPLCAPRPGSIGKALGGVEFRTSEEGELLIHSPALSSGYHNDPAATAELIQHGWLHTGDIGTIDPEGYIYITGRKKELIVSSNGKKIFPGRVETLFKFEPLISQLVLAGDRLPHLVALFTIQPSVAEAIPGAREAGMPLHEAPPVIAEVQRIVTTINKQLAPFEQIKRFRILHRDFSMEYGEVTATMKVRRKQVMENFRAELDELYRIGSSGRGGE